MAHTTFTDFESVEKEVVLEGHKWRLEDTEWESKEVEKEGIECDCCTHRIGTFDDDDFEPYATLAANPRQYMVDLFDREPIHPGKVKRHLRNRLTNQIDATGERISKRSASRGGKRVEHLGYTVKATAESGNYTGSDTDLYVISKGHLNHAINNALDRALPPDIYPSDDIHTEGELHFCEGCAEEFGVPTTHGHSSVEELPEDEDDEDAEDEDAGEASVDMSHLFSAALTHGAPGLGLFVLPSLVTEWFFEMDAFEFTTLAVTNWNVASAMLGFEGVIPLTFALMLALCAMAAGAIKLLVFYGLAISMFMHVFMNSLPSADESDEADHADGMRPPI